ncbi:hypothetical protein D3C81_1753030 [compost metagenome]
MAQGLKHVLVEIGRVMTGLEQAGRMTQYFFGSVSGDFHEGSIDVDNHTLVIGHQHTFVGAVEYRLGLAQSSAILIVLAQGRADPQASQQPRPCHEDQPGTEHHPQVTVDQLPAREISGPIE